MAQLEGVELIACKMTVDLTEIIKSKRLDNITVWTAEDLLKYTKDGEFCLITWLPTISRLSGT